MSVKPILSAIAVAFIASSTFAHLAPYYDASVRGWNRNVTLNDGERNVRSGGCGSFRGDWSASESYGGDHTRGCGDTVFHGTWPANDPNGKKLAWWAKFGASAGDEPGNIKEGGTSAWVLINSLSAAQHPQGKPNYQWRGWNGDLANNNASAPWAVVPTWRNGAQGAYSFTHDDIGAMPFETAVRPGWRVAQKFPEIKQGWGVFVGSMTQHDWQQARLMAMEGHEMFNHSMDHTSAANRIFIFLPGETVPSNDDIPAEIRGFEVVGAWTVAPHYAAAHGGAPAGWAANPVNWQTLNASGTASVPDLNGDWAGPVKGENNNGLSTGQYVDTLRISNDLVDIYTVPYWEGLSPNMEGPTLQKELGVERGIHRIEAKPGTKVITIATGQQLFVNEAQRKISANAVAWFELTDITSKFPFWNNRRPVGPNARAVTEGRCQASDSYVECDRGRPGMALGLWTASGWDNAGKTRNMLQSNKDINDGIYSWIDATPHFMRGKKSEYFGYPFDVFSEETHAFLEGAARSDADKRQFGEFVGARGGAKSGKPMSGDFFHPYRIDFDAFFIERKTWTPDSKGAGYVYPDNNHVLLGLNEMVDEIIATRGYMIREFHSVADIQSPTAWYDDGNNPDLWPVNNPGANVGGWWGGIAEFQLEAHYEYVQSRIDNHQIVVYTPSEAVKYRMVANAVTNVSVAAAGANYTLNVTASPIDAKYHDEISVIVRLRNAANFVSVEYGDGEGIDRAPYRKPKKMNTEGTVWSVNVNPYRGAATLIPNGEWRGVETSIPKQGNEITGISAGRTAAQRNAVSFTGIRNGQISLNLQAGNYTANLFNLQGRMVGSVNINAVAGVQNTGLRTDNLARGMFILQVKNAQGANVLNQRILVR